MRYDVILLVVRNEGKKIMQFFSLLFEIYFSKFFLVTFDFECNFRAI